MSVTFSSSPSSLEEGNLLLHSPSHNEDEELEHEFGVDKEELSSTNKSAGSRSPRHSSSENKGLVSLGNITTSLQLSRCGYFLRNHWRPTTFALSGAFFVIVFSCIIVLILMGIVPMPKEANDWHGGRIARGRFFQLSDIHYDPLYKNDFNSSFFCRTDPPPLFPKPTYSKMNKQSNNSLETDTQSTLYNINNTFSSYEKDMPLGRYGCDSPLTLVNST